MNEKEEIPFQKRFIESLWGELNAHDFDWNLVPAGSLNKQEIFDVYQRDFLIRVHNHFNHVFGETRKKVGPEIFFNLVIDYLRLTPVKDPNLTLFGQSFTEYLEKNNEHKNLAKLSLFEWNRYQLSLTKGLEENSLPLNLANLGNATFTFHDGLFLEKYHILFKVRNKDPSVIELDPLQYLILKKLMEGETISLALESAPKLIADRLDEDEAQKRVFDLFCLIQNNYWLKSYSE